MQRPPSLLPVCLCPKEQQIVSLPVEILAQVFMRLDFPSVHAVKLTCKTFYSVTKTRQFWYNHIEELIRVRHVTAPEETLGDYTVDELEEWALRRARAVDMFFKAIEPRFHERTVDLRAEGLSGLNAWNFKLLPGGRWLLVSNHSAILYFLDLDRPNPAPRLLFDPEEMDDEIRGSQYGKLSIWIDKGSPRLSFRLALFVKSRNILRTYVSQIDLVGHGSDATLAISNIAMLRHLNLDLRYAQMVLNDHYLVQVWCDHSPMARIRVYDYCKALGCPDYSISHEIDHEVFPGMLEFICDNMFAIQCLGSCSLSIFEIEPSPSLKVKLLHRIHMDTYPWSTPRWTPRATFITMVDRYSRAIQGLVIPHNPSRPPTILTLGKCGMDSGGGYILGTWVVVATSDNSHKVFSHDWDFDPPANVPPTFTYLPQEDLTTNLLTFDEDTGRFVSYPRQRQLVIHDFI